MKDGYYRGTQENVQAYIDRINGLQGFELHIADWKMSRWCDGAIECADGLYMCEPIPDFRLDQLGESQAEKEAIAAECVTDKLVEEKYDRAWAMEIEDV